MVNGDAGPGESLDGRHFFQDEPIEFCGPSVRDGRRQIVAKRIAGEKKKEKQIRHQIIDYDLCLYMGWKTLTVRSFVPFEGVQWAALQIVMTLKKGVPAGHHLRRHHDANDPQR